MWIKSRQSGKCPVSVFVDSALDCESKLLLARQVREYISLVLPYHLYCKPNAKGFWLRSFGMIWNRISDPRSVWIMVHQGNRRRHSGHGFTGSFDAPWWDGSWITDPDSDHPKGTHRLWSLEISAIICTLNLQWESHAGPHLKIGGCACWLWYTCPLSCIMHYCRALCMTITQKSWSCLECHNVCLSL